MASNALGFIKHDDMLDNVAVEDLVVERATVASGAVKLESVIVAEIPALVSGTTGAQGVHSLYAPGTTTVVTLPQGFTITRSYLNATTGVLATGAKTCTLAIGTSVTAALFMAATLTPMTSASTSPLVSAQVSPYPITTASETLKYTITTGAETFSAGRVLLYIYIVSTA